MRPMSRARFLTYTLATCNLLLLGCVITFVTSKSPIDPEPVATDTPQTQIIQLLDTTLSSTTSSQTEPLMAFLQTPNQTTNDIDSVPPNDALAWSPDGGYSALEPTPDNADMLAWGERAEQVNLPKRLCWGDNCADTWHLEPAPNLPYAEQIDESWLDVESLTPLAEVAVDSGPPVATGSFIVP